MECLSKFESQAAQIKRLTDKIAKIPHDKKVVKFAHDKEVKKLLGDKDKFYKEKLLVLRERGEKFRHKIYTLEKNRDNLKAKHETKIRTVSELSVDGLLSLTDSEIADRFFVDIAYVKNEKANIRRERNEKLQVNC